MILIFNFQANDERMRSESDYFQIKYCENCLYMNRIHWAKILFCCFISLSKDKMCRKGVECRAAASAWAGGWLLSTGPRSKRDKVLGSELCTTRECGIRMYLSLALNGPDPGDPEMPGDAGRRRPGAGHSSTHLPDFFKHWLVIVWAEYLWLPFKWMEVTRRWLGDVFETNLGTHGFHSNHRIEWM